MKGLKIIDELFELHLACIQPEESVGNPVHEEELFVVEAEIQHVHLFLLQDDRQRLESPGVVSFEYLADLAGKAVVVLVHKHPSVVDRVILLVHEVIVDVCLLEELEHFDNFQVEVISWVRWEREVLEFLPLTKAALDGIALDQAAVLDGSVVDVQVEHDD